MVSRCLFFGFLLMLLHTGCRDEDNDYNKRPNNLRGNVYQTLQEKGRFDYFLQAADMTGYRNLLDGGGLITAFVPDDAAFKSYLQQEYGTDVLTDVPANDLKLLVAYHLVEFSYTTDDLLGFTATANVDGGQAGDGSCYKYKTLAKEGVQTFVDPLSGREVDVYSREKYLPVISTRLYESRKSSDPASDYKAFFPTGHWSGEKDKLYVGNAAVKESGIPTLNGYLYILDQVVKPFPTIYQALEGKKLSTKYSTYKHLFDRLNCYEYQADLSKNYAQPGDSVFLFWHYKKPQKEAEIPEIASEWSYHNEAGKEYEKSLRYAATCLAPENKVLEAFLKQYFSNFGLAEAGDNYLDKIPVNAIFHFLQAHAYDKRDLIIPSQLEKEGIVGVNGEHFQVETGNIQDVEYCANGVVYGMNKCLVPAVFTSLTRPLFQYPQFKFFSLAFNLQGLYQQSADPYNRYTLFIQDDEVLQKEYNYACSESSTEVGKYQFLNKQVVMPDANVVKLILAGLVRGEITDPAEESGQRRYYVASDQATYFYTYGGEFYDETEKTLQVVDTFHTDNGIVYQLDGRFEKRTNFVVNRLLEPDLLEFCKLLRSVKLVEGTRMPFAQNVMAFIPTNEAVEAAISDGRIPVLNESSTHEDTLRMTAYLKYYFVAKQKNKLEHYLLPGLGADGITPDAYDFEAITSVDYVKESDARLMKITWNPATYPNQMVLTAPNGRQLMTDSEESPFFTKNGTVYLLDDCFDYRDILE